MAALLETMGYTPDSVEVIRRWSAEFDDVSKIEATDALKAAVPDAEVIVLDDVWHIFPLENPEVLVEILDGFLERRRAAH